MVRLTLISMRHWVSFCSLNLHSWNYDVFFGLLSVQSVGEQHSKCTYLLTPWSRVLLEKLIGFQPVKKFPAFYGTRRFITAFTSACHLSLSWASSIQSIPPHSSTWKIHLYIILLFTLGSSKCSLSLRFPHQNPVYASSLPPYALHALPISIFSILSHEK